MKRIALVTGSGKGIGWAIAQRLAGDDCFVIGVDVDDKSGADLESDFLPGTFRFIRADISREADVEKLFSTVSADHTRLDILVNNAGIIRDNLIWNMSVEDFDQVIGVNLKGTWLMCRAAAKLMKAQNGGRIVNISSRAWLGNRGQSNYSASKAGVVALTRVLALELGKYNVFVNAVAPGLIDTPLTQKLEPAVLQRLIDAQPTRAMGHPEDVAEAVAFLISEKNRFVTGQTIYVDGGKSIGAAV